jgi:hypothetical protein
LPQRWFCIGFRAFDFIDSRTKFAINLGAASINGCKSLFLESRILSLGAQATICAGGRYDGLVEKMGGNPCPSVGFALGLERLILLIQEQNFS